jgi:putative sterol carrier protein
MVPPRSAAPAAAKTDDTVTLFDRLDAQGHEPLLSHCAGTLRFDLSDGGGRTEHWLVRIKGGDVSVGHDDAPADCVVRARRSDFDAIASGRANAMAAVLRGALQVEGDLQLLMLFQRVLPGPPGARRSPGQAEAGDAR